MTEEALRQAGGAKPGARRCPQRESLRRLIAERHLSGEPLPEVAVMLEPAGDVCQARFGELALEIEIRAHVGTTVVTRVRRTEAGEHRPARRRRPGLTGR